MYGIVEEEQALQAGFTASSRRFKKAVDRNRIKRVLREAYRLRKTALHQKLAEQQKQMVLFFIYTGKEMPASTEVNDKMSLLLQKIEDQLLYLDNPE